MSICRMCVVAAVAGLMLAAASGSRAQVSLQPLLPVGWSFDVPREVDIDNDGTADVRLNTVLDIPIDVFTSDSVFTIEGLNGVQIGTVPNPGSVYGPIPFATWASLSGRGVAIGPVTGAAWAGGQAVPVETTSWYGDRFPEPLMYLALRKPVAGGFRYGWLGLSSEPVWEGRLFASGLSVAADTPILAGDAGVVVCTPTVPWEGQAELVAYPGESVRASTAAWAGVVGPQYQWYRDGVAVAG
ncbi:MAG: hypothetical protein K2Q20_08515, partial [Phycisphaerales bacterium]|nr:hypothetical protein [Phycisphaerales bacterium]